MLSRSAANLAYAYSSAYLNCVNPDQNQTYVYNQGWQYWVLADAVSCEVL